MLEKTEFLEALEEIEGFERLVFGAVSIEFTEGLSEMEEENVKFYIANRIEEDALSLEGFIMWLYNRNIVYKLGFENTYGSIFSKRVVLDLLFLLEMKIRLWFLKVRNSR